MAQDVDDLLAGADDPLEGKKAAKAKAKAKAEKASKKAKAAAKVEKPAAKGKVTKPAKGAVEKAGKPAAKAAKAPAKTAAKGKAGAEPAKKRGAPRGPRPDSLVPTIQNLLGKVRKATPYEDIAEKSGASIRTVRRTARKMRNDGQILLQRKGQKTYITPAV
jgi:ribosome-associated protein